MKFNTYFIIFISKPLAYVNPKTYQLNSELKVSVTLNTAYQVQIGQCPLHIGEPCNAETIKFYLLNHTLQFEMLDPFKPKLPTYFNKSAPTKIIIHGYVGNLDYATALLSKAYAENVKVNTIVVDWDSLSQMPCYPTAVLNTWQAGQCTAVLIVSLAALGMDPKNMHLLGFSLGAHVASYAANWIFSTMGVKIGRITGLDPALPFFATLKNDWKLDASDAEFVDIIHTNSGIYGKIEATGHVDFYVNGGTYQPACVNHKNPPICSHMLAPIYFAESISLPHAHGFVGVRCAGFVQYVFGWCRAQTPANNTAIMGEHCDKRSRGIFFVDTAPMPPFAINTKTKN